MLTGNTATPRTDRRQAQKGCSMTQTTREQVRFSDNALEVLRRRYLVNGETPEGMLERVSFGNEDYYNLMARLDFLPNSPTLFNAGTGMGTLSACFKFDVEDKLRGSQDSIMGTFDKAAAVQQYGGGVGYVFSNLRPKGAKVKTTNGQASGPVSFMKLYHALASTVTQGGKRNGAQMGILSCDHPDIQEFIHCKDVDPDGLSTFNISVAATDAWMNDCLTDDRSVAGSSLLWEMAESAWKTGDPGLYFIDVAEKGNPTPWLGKLTGTNPCGEVPLLNNEPCNLGSINLGHFVKRRDVDWERLIQVAHLATRFLDDILDHNTFPHPAIHDAAFATRKLGLGVMGWADMLALLGIHYASDEAVELGRKVMSAIDTAAELESLKLAQEKGVAPCFLEHGIPLRNATRTCIAPTGTISILADASSGIEPHFAREWTRYGYFGGERVPMKERIAVMEWVTDGFEPATAMEIDWAWHIRHQAAFQEHTNLAVSKTINMKEEVSVRDIYDAYVMMWESGCKGGTIYRDNCRATQVLNVEPAVVEGFSPPTLAEITPILHSPTRHRLPLERAAVNHRFQVGDQEGYVSVGLFEDGTPGELFITASKQGSTVRSLLDAIGVEASLLLQHGVPLDSLVSKFTATRFEPAGLTSNPALPVATSILDYVFRWMDLRFGSGKGITLAAKGEIMLDTGIFCPDCGAPAVMSEGCTTCAGGCGWSKC